MSKKILVIDDDPRDLDLLAQCLREAQLGEVEVAGGGVEGVRKAKSLRPDLVIVDTKMPVLDGFGVCEQIKAVGDLGAKVIILTGQIDYVDATKALSDSLLYPKYCLRGFLSHQS